MSVSVNVAAQDIDLTNAVWNINLPGANRDWTGSQATFTSQDESGMLTGYFAWETVDLASFGVERFEGMLLPDRTLSLTGSELLPHPLFGGPRNVSLVDEYRGEISDDGNEIINGTYGGRDLPWQGTRGLKPSTIKLSSKTLQGDTNLNNVFLRAGRFSVDAIVNEAELDRLHMSFIHERNGGIQWTLTDDDPDLAIAFNAALLSTKGPEDANNGGRSIENFDVEFVNPGANTNGNSVDDLRALVDGVVGTWTSGEYSGTISVACDLQAAGLEADGKCTAADIDLLTTAVRDDTAANTEGFVFDLDFDGDVDEQDRRTWVVELANTFYGDANLDGEFNSSDFVVVFQRAEFEDNIDGNSGWADGDWNGDGDFDSSDLVRAFSERSFEQGLRIPSVVPEPTSLGITYLSLLGLLWLRPVGRVGMM
jgi:hypothetical protein